MCDTEMFVNQSGNIRKPRIALTFDDGPNTGTSCRMLDVLEKNGVVATFFLVGERIDKETAVTVKREMALGCEICCHSLTHSPMDIMTPEQIRSEISDSVLKIKAVTGYEPAFFRPPYIAVSEAMFENIDMPFIGGIVCNDWEPEVTAAQRVEKVMANASDGCIILMHDMPGNEETVEAVKMLIPLLKENGYEFVTVSILFADAGTDPKQHRIWNNVYQKY